MLSILKWILLPFAIIYGIVIYIRNKLYDFNFIQSSSFDIPVICIGNLAVGGTGKTPHIAYIASLLKKNNLNPSILSRGYGRKTFGYILLETNTIADEAGDEPVELFNNLNDVPVAVSENRVIGVANLLYDKPETEVVLLDDAFQHRSIKAGLNILLTTFQNPYYKDFLMPVGYLREFSEGFKRADAIVVTKCPDNLNLNQKNNIIAKIKPMQHQKVFFSYLSYGNIYNMTQNQIKISLKDVDFVYFFAGIANANALNEYLSKHVQKFFIRKLADHVRYSETLVKNIINDFGSIQYNKKIMLTTQKDEVKLKQKGIVEFFEDQPIFVLPVEVSFYNQESFNQFIYNYVTKNK